MGLIVKNCIHRVYIVESATSKYVSVSYLLFPLSSLTFFSNRKPIGVISLRDIMLEAIPGGHW